MRVMISPLRSFTAHGRFNILSYTLTLMSRTTPFLNGPWMPRNNMRSLTRSSRKCKPQNQQCGFSVTVNKTGNLKKKSVFRIRVYLLHLQLKVGMNSYSLHFEQNTENVKPGQRRRSVWRKADCMKCCLQDFSVGSDETFKEGE